MNKMNKYIEINFRGYESRLDIINFLKAFSISTIVLMHYFQQLYLPSILNKAISIGGSGVHIFFFCSGLGLYLSYKKKPVIFRDFIKKRFLKIYIPYIVIVTVSVFLPYMIKGLNPIKVYLSHALLYKMFIPLYEETLGPFWFISTLIQLYLLFIPMMKLCKRIGINKLFILSCIVSGMWWVLMFFTQYGSIRVWGSFFAQYIWEFSLGFVFAERLVNDKIIQLNKKNLYFIAIVGISIAGLSKIIGGPFESINDVFTFFGYGSTALILFQNDYIKNIMLKISKYSYEIYLIHIIVFSTMQQIISNLIIAAIISIPTTYVLAYCYSNALSRFKLK